MEPFTRRLWSEQADRHPGDRERLFEVVAAALADRSVVTSTSTVLYPGSYVDVVPSVYFDDVTYLDMDDRAARFFADDAGVAEIVATQRGRSAGSIRFVHADYRDDVELDDESFDLLISLYAGPVSDHCTRHLRVGGVLLANPSHGDAALASLDDRYQLIGAVLSAGGRYRVDTADLDRYLIPKKIPKTIPKKIPKKDGAVTAEAVRASGTGVAYTRPAFAYLFERV